MELHELTNKLLFLQSQELMDRLKKNEAYINTLHEAEGQTDGVLSAHSALLIANLNAQADLLNVMALVNMTEALEGVVEGLANAD
jgi:hypothetical protein